MNEAIDGWESNKDYAANRIPWTMTSSTAWEPLQDASSGPSIQSLCLQLTRIDSKFSEIWWIPAEPPVCEPRRRNSLQTRSWNPIHQLSPRCWQHVRRCQCLMFSYWMGPADGVRSFETFHLENWSYIQGGLKVNMIGLPWVEGGVRNLDADLFNIKVPGPVRWN